MTIDRYLAQSIVADHGHRSTSRTIYRVLQRPSMDISHNLLSPATAIDGRASICVVFDNVDPSTITP
ncbi:MAG: hypothetical protein ABJG18_15070, partial [Lentilitoribacter sp.]